MVTASSQFQRHRTLCANPGVYPNTQLRDPRPHEVHTLKKHAKYLEENDERLFNDDSDEHLTDIFEIDAEKSINLKVNQFRTCDTQLQHMQHGATQWDIRHVFFKANDSRSPLNCSSDMLKSCFTFHQVDASFLESLYTFGDQEKPLDLCLAHFKSSHTIDLDEGNLIAIPELRLSGRDLRMSYLLRSMEKDTNSSNQNKWKWNLRQTAVYHSFDVETGQSFWCNIKANDEFKNRIKDSISHLNLGKPGMKQDHRVHRLFAAALSTHLIYLLWCDENWRWCINDMEVAINEILQKARLAEIDDTKSTVPEHLLRRATTMNSTISRQTRGNATQASSKFTHRWLRAPHRCVLILRELLFGSQKSINDVEMGIVGSSTDPKPRPDRKPQPVQHPLLTLDQFRVSELQALQLWGERIERWVLAVQLNITVLREISAYYSSLTGSLVKLHPDMGKQYELEIRHFGQEIKNIVRGLETRKIQLQSLAAQLSEGQKLYDGLLQYRNIQIGQTFAESAETSASKMQTIAYKTAQETASMHIITIVTLIFLPGTFVATFFQSGVFWWKEAPDDLEGAWSYRGDAFAFFSSLCFPLMIATLGIWLGVWYKMRRDRHKEEQKNFTAG